jgi:hypothetical protein
MPSAKAPIMVPRMKRGRGTGTGRKGVNIVWIKKHFLPKNLGIYRQYVLGAVQQRQYNWKHNTTQHNTTQTSCTNP